MTAKNNVGIHISENQLCKNTGDEQKPILHIIDDCYDMRKLLKGIFIDSYQVIGSIDGLKGFKKATAIIPDIIISDVKMPGINGIKLCRLLKEDQRTNQIPIVLITGDNADECVLNGLNNGADDYVCKPFNYSILKARVNNLIKSRRLIKLSLNVPEVLHAQSRSNNPDSTFLIKAYEIIELNLNNSEFEANDFAKAIGMSRAQIYRRIKAATGQSVKEFIRATRLQRAAKLLVNTNQNISEIAFQVGFSSVAYFSSSFSKYFKMNPSKYMLLNRGKGF
jgi:YesN/AraC family two-component response regulator